MSVSSRCILLNIRINENNYEAALTALIEGLDIDGYSRLDFNIEACASLAEALNALEFDSEVKENHLIVVGYKGGVGEVFDFVFPALAPFIEDGSKLVMEHDGEKEVILFHDGEYTIIPDDDGLFFEDEAPTGVNEEAMEFFGKVLELDASVEDVKNFADKKGVQALVDGCGKTALVALLEPYICASIR